jgi:RNA polymerase sigma-70 factor (ECF subfamily)
MVDEPRMIPLSSPRTPEAAAPGSDDALLERAIAGDSRAWTRLYQTHFDRLYRDVAFLVGGNAATEEIVQETFAIAWTKLAGFDGRSSFATWLRGIAHNLVRRHWRTRERRGRAYEKLAQIADDAAPRERDPEGTHLQDERAEALQTVLETLPAALREAFVLCDVQGLAPQEVADRLGISNGNVRVRAARARAQIREALQRMGWLAQEGSS